MLRSLSIVAALVLAAPVFAESHSMDLSATGDASEGEKAFRQCIACHVVQNADGEVLAGRNAKTGPNLFGVVGRKIGSVEDFRYSDLILAAGAAEMVWNQENFVGYVQDPTGWLQEATGDKGRGKMSFKVRKEEDAVNLYAYLYSLAPPQ